MHKDRKRRFAVAAALAVAASTALTSPASANPLTNVAWSLSKPHPGDTAVDYTWTFTTGSLGNVASVTFTVPDGTGDGGGLSVEDVSGIPGTGSAALDTTTSPDTVTYTIPALDVVAVQPTTAVLVSIGGFTNKATATSLASTVTTRTSVPGNIDTAMSPAVAINNNNTDVEVIVARSTAFASDTTSFRMLMDPSVAALKDQTKAVTLTIATNARLGYTLNTKVDQVLTGTNPASTFAAASNGVATGVATGSFAAGTFGYMMTTSGGTRQGALNSGDYVGYTTAAGENALVRATPTNGDTVVLTNRAMIDYTQKADTYTGRITYTVTPSY